MDDFEKKKKELLTPLLIEMGAALIDCQKFEYGVALLLLHLSRLGAVGLEPEEHFAIMDNKAKKTAGQLITMLKQRAQVSEGIQEALADALEARNFLMHRAFVDNVERATEPESRAELVREFGRLRARVQTGDKAISPFIHAFSAALDGVEIEQVKADVSKALMGEPLSK